MALLREEFNVDSLHRVTPRRDRRTPDFELRLDSPTALEVTELHPTNVEAYETSLRDRLLSMLEAELSAGLVSGPPIDLIVDVVLLGTPPRRRVEAAARLAAARILDRVAKTAKFNGALEAEERPAELSEVRVFAKPVEVASVGVIVSNRAEGDDRPYRMPVAFDIDLALDSFATELLKKKSTQARGYERVVIVVVNRFIIADTQDLHAVLMARAAEFPRAWWRVYEVAYRDGSSAATLVWRAETSDT